MTAGMKNIVLRRAGIILFLIGVCAHARAQGDWQLKRNEDGIKVFTRNDDSTSFKCIRVECTVNATPSQLVALLMDMNRQPDWVYGSKSAEVLKTIKPNEFVFHSEVEVPWPCSDRDYIAHIVINQASPQLVTIDSRSEPDLLPLRDGVVRVKKSRAHWDVTTVEKNVVKILYTVSFDPSGAVPAWLTNMFVTKGPFLTFQKLKDKVAMPAYQNAHYDFIKE